MQNYCVNKQTQANGDHEVHVHSCRFVPDKQNQHPLGLHTDCMSAVSAAKRIYPRSNGCYYCSRPCHTQ